MLYYRHIKRENPSFGEENFNIENIVEDKINKIQKEKIEEFKFDVKIIVKLDKKTEKIQEKTAMINKRFE